MRRPPRRAHSERPRTRLHTLPRPYRSGLRARNGWYRPAEPAVGRPGGSRPGPADPAPPPAALIRLLATRRAAPLPARTASPLSRRARLGTRRFPRGSRRRRCPDRQPGPGKSRASPKRRAHTPARRGRRGERTCASGCPWDRLPRDRGAVRGSHPEYQAHRPGPGRGLGSVLRPRTAPAPRDHGGAILEAGLLELDGHTGQLSLPVGNVVDQPHVLAYGDPTRGATLDLQAADRLLGQPAAHGDQTQHSAQQQIEEVVAGVHRRKSDRERARGEDEPSRCEANTAPGAKAGPSMRHTQARGGERGETQLSPRAR